MNPPSSDPVATAFVLGLLALLPFLAVLATSYTKLVIVFSLVRTAIGTQQTPPNIVLNSLALIISAYIMAPIGMQAMSTLETQRTSPAAMTFDDAVRVRDAVSPALKSFLARNSEERDKRFFVRSATQLWPKEQAEQLQTTDLLVLVPAFTMSELTKAFQIGFALYLVFVVVDMVVANILLALGMSMMSPTVISIPFKLLIFVVLDGWSHLIQGLVLSYRGPA
jgi:type III secretion protein R